MRDGRIKGALLVTATVLLLAAAYLAGLSYCASAHGLGYYGVNRGNAPSLLPPLLQRIYNPALFALARYYKCRQGPFGGDDPLDVEIADRLFLRQWPKPRTARQQRPGRVPSEAAPSAPADEASR